MTFSIRFIIKSTCVFKKRPIAVSSIEYPPPFDQSVQWKKLFNRDVRMYWIEGDNKYIEE